MCCFYRKGDISRGFYLVFLVCAQENKQFWKCFGLLTINDLITMAHINSFSNKSHNLSNSKSRNIACFVAIWRQFNSFIYSGKTITQPLCFYWKKKPFCDYNEIIMKHICVVFKKQNIFNSDVGISKRQFINVKQQHNLKGAFLSRNYDVFYLNMTD